MLCALVMFRYICKTSDEEISVIACNSLFEQLDKRLEAFSKSTHQSFQERLKSEYKKIMEQIHYHQAIMMNSAINDKNGKDMRHETKTEEANDFVLSALKTFDTSVKSLETAIATLSRKCKSEHVSLKSLCNTTEEQVVAIDSLCRKSSFIIRNFPEDEFEISIN